MRKSLWRNILSDGTAVQLIEFADGHKEIEITPQHGVNLETEGSEECARFAVQSFSDIMLLASAINEAHEGAEKLVSMANASPPAAPSDRISAAEMLQKVGIVCTASGGCPRPLSCTAAKRCRDDS